MLIDVNVRNNTRLFTWYELKSNSLKVHYIKTQDQINYQSWAAIIWWRIRKQRWFWSATRCLTVWCMLWRVRYWKFPPTSVWNMPVIKKSIVDSVTRRYIFSIILFVIEFRTLNASHVVINYQCSRFQLFSSFTSIRFFRSRQGAFW